MSMASDKAFLQIAAGFKMPGLRLMDVASLPANPGPPTALVVAVDADGTAGSVAVAASHDSSTTMGTLNALPTVESLARVVLGSFGPTLDVADPTGTTLTAHRPDPLPQSSGSAEADIKTASSLVIPGPQAADLLAEFLPTSGDALVKAVDVFLDSIDDLAPPEEDAPGLPIPVRAPLAWLASGVAVEVIRRSFTRREKEEDEESGSHHDRPSWPGVPRFPGLPGR
jgi:hypothetical protein